MSPLAPLWRGLRIAEHLLTGASLAIVIATGQGLGYRVLWLDTVVCWWYQRLLRCLRISVRVDGAAAETTLMVANHISWLDIPVIGSQGKMRFLSKAEVRRWPIIGWMSELAGTVFIDRGAHRVDEVVAGVCTRIQAGQPVVVFPEGTTSDGREVQRFHPRLFAICQQTGLAVQPIALRYGEGQEPDRVAPFVGDETLVAHLWRLLRHPGLQVRVSFLDPIPVASLDRRRLAEATRTAIATRLAEAAPEPMILRSSQYGGKHSSRDGLADPGEAQPPDRLCQAGNAP